MSYFHNSDSIIGGPLDDLVLKQLGHRTKLLNKRSNRTDKDLLYLNSNTAWVKLMSSVDVKDTDGSYTSKLAQRYVMLGGTLYGEKIKQGFNYIPELNRNFGLPEHSTLPNSTYELSNLTGYVPMPGIDSFTVAAKNQFGTLRAASVEFKANSIEQLTDLEQIYLRPGFSVLLQWGHSLYLDSSGKLSDIDYSIGTDFFSYTSKEKVIEGIKNGKKNSNNNYDGLIGFIKNFTWKYNRDGTYDCKVDIISSGELVESLQAIIHPSSTDIGQGGTPPSDEEGSTDYRQNATPLHQFLYTLRNGNEANSDISNNTIVTTLKQELEAKNRSFKYYRFLKSNLESAPFGPTDDKYYTYVPISHILEVINLYFTLKSSGKPIVKFYTESVKPSTKTPFVTFEQHYMIDPEVGFLPKPAFTGNILNTSVIGFEFPSVASGLEVFNDILNICVNVNYAIKVFDSVYSSTNITDQVLLSFIENLLAGIQDGAGQINDFDIHYEEDEFQFYIIDRNVTPATPSSQLDVVGLGSTVHDFNLSSKLTSRITSMVAISAQASATDMGEELLSMQRWNLGLVDRIFPKKHIKTSFSDETNTQIQVEDLIKFCLSLEIAQSNAVISGLTGAPINKYMIRSNDGEAEGLKPLHRKLMSTFVSFNSNNKKAATPGLIPLALDLTLDGIGGIKIGQAFTIPPEIMPGRYADSNGKSRIAFLVTGVSHKIQNNKWLTDLTCQMILIDNVTVPTGIPANIEELILKNSDLTGNKDTDTGCTTTYSNLPILESVSTDLMSYSEAASYLNSKYGPKLGKAVFGVIWAEAAKAGTMFKSAGGHNYGGVQTDCGKWGAADKYFNAQFCRIDSGGKHRMFASFATYQDFLDFMASRIQAKGFTDDPIQWTTTYITKWWSPANKAEYIAGSSTFEGKKAIFQTAVRNYEANYLLG